MTQAEIARITADPSFVALTTERRRFSWTLAIVMMATYFGFLLIVAFDRHLAISPIAGGPLTVAFPLGMFVIVTAIVLTGVYVARANSTYDRLTAQVVAAHAGVDPVSPWGHA